MRVGLQTQCCGQAVSVCAKACGKLKFPIVGAFAELVGVYVERVSQVRRHKVLTLELSLHISEEVILNDQG